MRLIEVHRSGCPGDGCQCPAPSPSFKRRVQEALAIGRIAGELRFDPHDAWATATDKDRLNYARAVLRVRLRLNRAGLLRWRVIRREGGDDAR